ncbi:MAG: imelysin family protein [Myxococcota bacterium]
MKLHGWLFIGLFTLLALGSPSTGCGPEQPAGVDASMYLAAIGPEVILPELRAFKAEAEAFEAALEAADRPDEARPAFVSALLRWQRLEGLQVGPASSPASPGGQALRDRIYSWPIVDPCDIDRFIVQGALPDATFFDDVLVDRIGLDAIEYLLFSGKTQACGEELEETWMALAPEVVTSRRLAHARFLAADVTATADALIASWEGDFAAAFNAFDSTEALNAVFEAMFYLETQTKDRKLGQPLGLVGCSSECATQAEGQLSATGAEAIGQNLAGFEALYRAGMDDIVRDQLRRRELANAIDDALDEARGATSGVDGDLALLIETDRERVEALHAAVKSVTDLLKLDLATVLMLQIPREVAGDND